MNHLPCDVVLYEIFKFGLVYGV